MECPICGELFDSDDMEILDNGNPACHDCVLKEDAKDDK